MTQPFDNRDWDLLQITKKEDVINRLTNDLADTLVELDKAEKSVEELKAAYSEVIIDRDIASAQCRKAGEQITELEETIYQKDELLRHATKALEAANHCLGVIRNAEGNTLNPHEISSEADYTHCLVRCALEELRKAAE